VTDLPLSQSQPHFHFLDICACLQEDKGASLGFGVLGADIFLFSFIFFSCFMKTSPFFRTRGSSFSFYYFSFYSGLQKSFLPSNARLGGDPKFENQFFDPPL